VSHDFQFGDERKIFYDEVEDGMVVTVHIADSGAVREVDPRTRKTRGALQHFRVIGDSAPYTLQAIQAPADGAEVVRLCVGSWFCA